LEFGYWTEEPALLEGAQRFLLQLVQMSEPLDTESDSLQPEFVPVKLDDEAFADLAAESWYEDEDDI
jgi:hypothetical protein